MMTCLGRYRGDLTTRTHRRIDEIRVQTMQTGPSELIGMNPDITAFVRLPSSKEVALVLLHRLLVY